MLSGRHVSLRAIESEDLERLRAWRNRPELRRYFREYREISSVQQRSWYENVVLGSSTTIMFALSDSDGGRLLGAAGLCGIDWVRRVADLSLYLGEGYIDDQRAPDALQLLVGYAFEELGLHRVWSEVYAFDTAKTALYERAGFTLEGRHRDAHFAEGGWHDSLFFGLLAGEAVDDTAQ